MTPSGEGEGQIVVWDMLSGSATHAYLGEHGFGFEPDERLLLWAPTGRLIASTEGANGIVVVKDGKRIAGFLPDDTQDYPVGFCWLADMERLYAAAWEPTDGGATGAVLSVRDGGLGWILPGLPPEVFIRMT